MKFCRIMALLHNSKLDYKKDLKQKRFARNLSVKPQERKSSKAPYQTSHYSYRFLQESFFLMLGTISLVCPHSHKGPQESRDFKSIQQLDRGSFERFSVRHYLSTKNLTHDLFSYSKLKFDYPLLAQHGTVKRLAKVLQQNIVGNSDIL